MTVQVTKVTKTHDDKYHTLKAQPVIAIGYGSFGPLMDLDFDDNGDFQQSVQSKPPGEVAFGTAASRSGNANVSKYFAYMDGTRKVENG